MYTVVCERPPGDSDIRCGLEHGALGAYMRPTVTRKMYVSKDGEYEVRRVFNGGWPLVRILLSISIRGHQTQPVKLTLFRHILSHPTHHTEIAQGAPGIEHGTRCRGSSAA